MEDRSRGKGRQSNASLDSPEEHRPGVKVPVHEDFLFDVDIQNRELAPAYWLGPIFEVKRGTWFFDESGKLRPCDENLVLDSHYLFLSRFFSFTSFRHILYRK